MIISRVQNRLEAGGIGTVVLIHQGGKGYEVEFVTLSGESVVASLLAEQVRSISSNKKY